jgi:hypothetical protein
MPYANHRPSYAPGQELEVWENFADEDGGVWVEGPDGQDVRIEWEPGTPRAGVWDMGHATNFEYGALRMRYLSKEISLETFLEQYRDVDRYEVQHPTVNRSRRNEAPWP